MGSRGEALVGSAGVCRELPTGPICGFAPKPLKFRMAGKLSGKGLQSDLTLQIFLWNPNEVVGAANIVGVFETEIGKTPCGLEDEIICSRRIPSELRRKHFSDGGGEKIPRHERDDGQESDGGFHSNASPAPEAFEGRRR